MNAAILSNGSMARRTGLGCACQNYSLDGPGEDIFDSLSGYLLTSKAPITFHSKPPGDWFPIVDNEQIVPKGTFMGSIIDFKATDEGLWLEANAVSPSWFPYDPSKVEMKKKDSSVTLSEQQKEDVLRTVIEAHYPTGGGLVVGATDVVKSTVELAKDTLHAASKLIKYLPWIAVGVGAFVVYVKYGDDIKKAFNK